MTDEEALREIDRKEKRLAAAEAEEGCVAAKRKAEELVAAAEKAEAEGRIKIAEAKKLRSRAVHPAPSGSLHEGDANLGQAQSKPKRSPLEINPQAERGVWCFGGGGCVVAKRLSGEMKAEFRDSQSPFKRLSPARGLATLLRKATFGRTTLAYARRISPRTRVWGGAPCPRMFDIGIHGSF